jgi:hypothetical protein
MTAQKNKMRPWLKRLLIIGAILLVAGVIAVWYIFSASFSDTAAVKPDYEVSARNLIKEFQQNDSLSNRKYAEKIILVRGVVTDIEQADTTVNIKMADTTSGAYIIFAFQQQHLAEAKKIKTGDSVAIKGSCSGGAYSQILETEYISFKRSTLTR